MNADNESQAIGAQPRASAVSSPGGVAHLPLAEPKALIRKLVSIDILRGLAAFGVALSHAQGAYWRDVSPKLAQGNASEFFTTLPLYDIIIYMFHYGGLGVPLFFVISGFCIHLPYAELDGTGKPFDVREFAIRRFLRLYPLFISVAIAAFMIEGVHKGWGQGEVTWQNFLGHLFFWFYFTDPATSPGMGISPPMWTIAIEAHFYVLYVLALPLLRRFGFARCVIGGLVIDVAYRLVVLNWQLDQDMPRALLPHRLAPTRFGEWLLGAWIAEAFVSGRLRRVPAIIGTLGRALVCGLALVVLGIWLAYIDSSRDPVYAEYMADIPATLGFAIMLVGFLHSEITRLDKWTQRRHWYSWAIWLGHRSYSLYLTHLLVISITVDIGARLMHVDKDSIARTPQLFLLSFGLGIALSIVVANITYRLIEEPSHRLGRWLADKCAAGAK